MPASQPTHSERVQQLFLEHAGLLRGFVLGFIPDPHRANDVLQEVFLTITHKAEEFQLGTNFLAWARTIARYKLLEHYRQEARNPLPLSPEEFELLSDSAVEMDADWEPRRQALTACLDQLAPRAREAMDLRYVQDLLPPQIAEKLAWGVNAVHVALARARKFLRECVQEQMAAVGE